MKLIACIALWLLISCGQKKSNNNSNGSSNDTLPTTADSVTAGNTPVIPDESYQPTATESEISELLKEKFGGTLLVVNDTMAEWPKDEFDYFIAPKRKEQPDYPYIATGDFNGDGQRDAAALVKKAGSSEYMVAILFGSPLDKHPILFWKEDIDLCAVSTYPRGPLEGMGTGIVKMKGDGINIEFYERASFVLYWNGSAFKRAQTGD